MGEFIKVGIDFGSCVGVEKCGECIKVCPVNIFEAEGKDTTIVESNEDECTLCELCTQVCKPGAITIRKLYEL